jgi:hypothetical protein
MEYQLEMKRQKVASDCSLTCSLAKLLGENPAPLAAELLTAFHSTELHQLLLSWNSYTTTTTWCAWHGQRNKSAD